MKADEFLRRGAEVWREHEKNYGPSYNQVGCIMERVFPDGVNLSTRDDFRRFGIMVQIVTKLARYTNTWSKPHADSIFDIGVYSMILAEIDDEICDP